MYIVLGSAKLLSTVGDTLPVSAVVNHNHNHNNNNNNHEGDGAAAVGATSTDSTSPTASKDNRLSDATSPSSSQHQPSSSSTQSPPQKQPTNDYDTFLADRMQQQFHFGATNSNESLFAYGSPQYVVHSHAISRSHDRRFFIVLTEKSIHLWSTRPSVEICRSTRRLQSIKEHGGNKQVYWKPNGTGVVVTTWNGYLYFYEVYQEDRSLLSFQFSNSHHYVNGAGEGNGIPHAVLDLKRVVKIEDGISCVLPLPNHMIVFSVNKPTCRYMNWLGDVGEAESLKVDQILSRDTKQDENENTEESNVIWRVFSGFRFDLFVWLTAKNELLLVRRRPSNTSTQTTTQDNAQVEDFFSWESCSFHTKEFTGDDAIPTCVSINVRFMLLAVATMSGDIYVYRFEDSRTAKMSVKFLRIFKFRPPSGTTVRLSPISTLEWSTDGYALACGWIKGGLSIWSVFGKCLFCTCGEDTWIQSGSLLNLFSDSANEDGALPTTVPGWVAGDAYFAGVQDLFWGAGSTDLFILSSFATLEPRVDVYCLPIAKSSLTISNTMDNTLHTILHTDSKLLINEATSLDLPNLALRQWETVQVPMMYMAYNWPIRYTSIDSEGKYIAVAGRRGFTHYSIISGKWKLFGNEYQEQNLVVKGGMVWFRNILVVACQDLTTKSHELRFFSRERNLDMNYAIHVERVSKGVLSMHIFGDYLMVLTADEVLKQYKLGIVNGTKFQMDALQSINLTGFKLPLGSYISLAWFPCFIENLNDDVVMASLPIILLKAGTMIVIYKPLTGENEWRCKVLADGIEYFWISSSNERIGNLLNSLWAYDGTGFKVWTNVLLPEYIPLQWRHSLQEGDCFKIELDFYPLEIMMDRGIIIGVEQRLSVKNSLECALFRSEFKLHLFLNVVIKHILGLKLEAEAVKFAEYFSDWEYFEHALEVLLHQVLEVEADTRPGRSPDALLPLVVSFLEHFPNFLEIIVRCARKTEVAVWEYFFSIVGDSMKLFRKCLDQGLLETATNYLIIIQTLEAPGVSGTCAMELLEKAFEMEDYKICKELVRFLTTIDGSGYVMYQELHKFLNSNVSEEKDFATVNSKSLTMPDGTDLFYLEVLISKHARKLLLRQRLRALGQLSKILSFPLTEWLKREKHKSGLITDFNSALMALHQQFCWPFPDDQTVPVLHILSQQPRQTPTSRVTSLSLPFSVANSFNNGGGSLGNIYARSEESLRPKTGTDDSDERHKRRAISFTVGNRLPADRNEYEEIRALVKITYSAGCWGWCMLLCCLLMDVSTLVKLFGSEDTGELFVVFRGLMVSQKSQGYHKLLQVVDSLLQQPQEPEHKKQ